MALISAYKKQNKNCFIFANCQVEEKNPRAYTAGMQHCQASKELTKDHDRE